MAYSKRELLSAIDRLAEELGRTPKQREMHTTDGYPSMTAFRNHFGNWSNAVEESSLDPCKKWYSDEELIDSLQQLSEELGRTPTQHEMDDADGYPSQATFQNHFGSWNGALEEAGLDINVRYEYSKEELTTYLSEFYEELGRTPTTTDITEADDYPFADVFIEKFGSWNEALESAEIPTIHTPLGEGSEWSYGPGWTREDKEEVRKRADHTCEHPLCDRRRSEDGRKLDVHHIVPHRVGVLEGYFESKEEANDLSNLITLCKEHHRELEPIIVPLD